MPDPVRVEIDQLSHVILSPLPDEAANAILAGAGARCGATGVDRRQPRRAAGSLSLPAAKTLVTGSRSEIRHEGLAREGGQPPATSRWAGGQAVGGRRA